MRARALWALILAVGLSCSGFAVAAEEDDAKDEYTGGGYVGAGALYSFENFDLADVPTGSTSANGSWGFDSRVGYRYPWFAAELQFQYFDEFTLNNQGASVVEQNGQAFSVNVKGFPLRSGRFQPYVLAGMGFLRLAADVQGSGAAQAAGLALTAESGKTTAEFMGRFGAGLDAYITPNVGLYVEGTYLFPKGELSDFQMIPVALGVQYRFGN